METADEKLTGEKNGLTNGITKDVDSSYLNWAEHITIIDLSNKNLKNIDEKTKFPPNLYDLSLSHNNLSEVPNVVLKLDKIRHLDLSYNSITYFDDTPSFCHTIEALNLSWNHLAGPPYWVWLESPKNLSELNLNYNVNITNSLTDIYIEELLNYSVKVANIKIANCRLHTNVDLICTFERAKSLELGVANFSSFCNVLEEIPCIGLDKCCDIERLNLQNTRIYNIKANIDMFMHLVEIDLSMNNIGGLPKEFCNLEKLEICILSYNNLLYLPDDINKLKKLVRLHMDNNELCMLPDRIIELKSLEFVDLYNNCLNEVPDEIQNVKELDLAQNYFDEPDNEEYLVKKEKLRINITDRYDGRKVERVRQDSEHSNDITDDEEEFLKSIEENNKTVYQQYDPPSSPEDWDSDKYWVPCSELHCTTPSLSPWMFYVKQKMAEGNFCPMDAHTVPIVELVKYENKCNPKVWVEVEGQFDDYSDDDS
ncbi:leucine-rich repeat protein soc-2 homolog [Amyelois transitella]|uniref:leucine-rich repeat protein soc-2 homolog n=1 Tax=Amyelois transitella TaxID=680683 RepID=UPI00067ABCE2|nr:leucine-rich repeat protein soc-2 homolog [Amyelois transitella]